MDSGPRYGTAPASKVTSTVDEPPDAVVPLAGDTLSHGMSDGKRHVDSPYRH